MTVVDAARSQPAGLGRRILRSAAAFTAGQTLAMAASIVRVAVGGRYLDTADGGTWLGLQLVLTYGANLHLGSVFGMFRSVPLLRAQGNLEGAKDEESTGLAFAIVLSLVSVLPLFVVTGRVCPAASTRQVVMTTGLVIVGLFRSYLNALFKAEQRFAELARAMSWGAAAALASTVLVAWRGLDGLIISTGLQAALETFMLLLKARLPRPRLKLTVLRAQLTVGSLTLLTVFGFSLLTTVDRTVMIRRLGTDIAGLYYVGANIMLLLPAIAGMPAAVLTPQFFERVGRGEDIRPLVSGPISAAAPAFAALIAIGSAALGPVVTLFAPRFAAGLGAAHCALFTTYPLVLAGLVSNVFYARNKQALHIGILAACVATGFGCATLGAIFTHEILWTAVGASAGIFLYYPLAAVVAFSLTGGMRDGVWLVVRSAVPVLYAAGAAFVVVWGMRYLGSHGPLLSGLIAVTLTTLLVTPLLLRAYAVFRRGLASPQIARDA